MVYRVMMALCALLLAAGCASTAEPYVPDNCSVSAVEGGLAVEYRGRVLHARNDSPLVVLIYRCRELRGE